MFVWVLLWHASVGFEIPVLVQQVYFLCICQSVLDQWLYLYGKSHGFPIENALPTQVVFPQIILQIIYDIQHLVNVFTPQVLRMVVLHVWPPVGILKLDSYSALEPHTCQHAALCLEKLHSLFCLKPFSQSWSLCFLLSALAGRQRKEGGEKGEDFQFEASGFVSKPSVVWLNYKRTCLITSLSRACQRLHPKNKTWHIKKNAICFEWW